jgi:thiosulfate/3-mercaptopyruvate sulfurtransferase
MSFQFVTKIVPGLVLALSLLTTSWGSESPAVANNSTEAMDSLVSAEWLTQHLDDVGLVVLDATVLVRRAEDGSMEVVSGRENYDAGHIPGAGFADLMGALSDQDSPLQFAMPSMAQFVAAMGALGVGDDSRVVLYDASGMAWAARVWWMLRWAGFDNTALLDGGLKAWTSLGLPLSTEQVARAPGTLTPAPRPELIADRDEVLAAIGKDNVTLIDSLPAASYRGEMAMYARPGHITGAVNIPVFSAFDEQGRYKPNDELAKVFEVAPDNRNITYCGGGIAASANAFALTRLGHQNVAVYAASLQEWAADPANPMETVPPAEE